VIDSFLATVMTAGESVLTILIEVESGETTCRNDVIRKGELG
jgi:hypothetical protein